MNDLKWADVAHMYIKSGIEVEYPCESKKSGKRRAILTGITLDEMETTYRRKERSRSGGLLRGDLLGLKPNGYHDTDALHTKPILRHLEDMTPSEIIECLMLSWPEQTKWTVKSYETFPDHSIFGHAFRYKIEFNENPPSSCCGTLSFNSLCPKQFHWCYGRGFDMNRLIESGEAIRKEASNG